MKKSVNGSQGREFKAVSIRLNTTLHARLKRAAENSRRSVSAQASLIIEEGLKKAAATPA